MADYITALKQATEELILVLKQKGVSERYLTFGGPDDTPIPNRVPTDARSEFLANRAMGDWAENILADTIRREMKELAVVPYGDTDTKAAGEDGFKEAYLSKTASVRKYGKRPDLLIFKANAKVPADLTTLETLKCDPHLKHAISAIEVRSSKFDALTYMKVRTADKEAGKKGIRLTPSFTVKVEDLRIVYRWIERYKIPEFYFQVFFDSVFAIDFLTVFQTIASRKDFNIETPAKSQEKATILIPITSGLQVGTFETQPEFTAEHRVTRLGRHDAFVKPVGGDLKLHKAKLQTLLVP